MAPARTSARIRRSEADHLPHNLEAERALLGSLLIDPDAVVRARATGLVGSHFYHEHHRWIWEAVAALAERFAPADIVSVSDVLAARPAGSTTQLDAIGGAAALTDLIAATPTSVYAAHYAEIVARTAQQRRLIAAAAQVAALAHAHEGPIEALFEAATQAFMVVVSTRGASSHLYGSDQALADYLTAQMERAEMLAANPDAALHTGLSDLDRILGDLPGGSLHAIVARSSVGKTMYMEHLTEHNARRGHRVAFYHLELSHEYMLDRRMARLSGIPLPELRRGYNGPEISQAVDAMREWQRRIVYVHCPGWTAERIAADMVKLAALGECDLAVVDYLQKIALPAENRYGLNAAQAIGMQAEALKNAAESAHVPVVIGSQVSRGYRQNSDKRPRIEDVRNSGELEEKANQVVILHRPTERESRPAGAATEVLEAHVEKNTGGSVGMCKLVHVLGRYRLGDWMDPTQSPDIPF